MECRSNELHVNFRSMNQYDSFISVLRTVCRKCIYKKIIDEEVDYCPKCKGDLGVSPLEKLRYLIT